MTGPAFPHACSGHGVLAQERPGEDDQGRARDHQSAREKGLGLDANERAEPHPKLLTQDSHRLIITERPHRDGKVAVGSRSNGYKGGPIGPLIRTARFEINGDLR